MMTPGISQTSNSVAEGKSLNLNFNLGGRQQPGLMNLERFVFEGQPGVSTVTTNYSPSFTTNTMGQNMIDQGLVNIKQPQVVQNTVTTTTPATFTVDADPQALALLGSLFNRNK